MSDPQANTTTIDAAGDGRPVSIIDTGIEVVRLAGFTLTGGDYTGLGNPPGPDNHVCRNREGQDCGGGLYVYASTLELDQCVVSGNVASTVAGDGGGIYLWKARAITLSNIEVSNNEAVYTGGGLHVEEQRFPLNISDSAFSDNTAGQGGGIALATNIEALVTIERCSLNSNSATSGDGGGLYARLTANGEMLALDEVVISDNTAWEQGKGLQIESAGPVTPQARLTNLLLSGNGPAPGAPESGEDAVLAPGPGTRHRCERVPATCRAGLGEFKWPIVRRNRVRSCVPGRGLPAGRDSAFDLRMERHGSRPGQPARRTQRHGWLHLAGAREEDRDGHCQQRRR